MRAVMLDKLKKTILAYNMFSAQARVLAAVSGGPDSMALLSVLKRLQPEMGLDVIVASFDHSVRKNSARDVEFVRTQARKMDLPFFSEKRKSDRRKVSEELLRKARYDFLLRVSGKTRADCIALGHTLDDQAETVMMRLIRGSGLWGMSAIVPVRELEGRKLVRPLINIARCDIMDYLKKERISFRLDETNSEEIFLRNKVRARLIPFLEKEFNPNIREALSRVALSVGADYAYLASKADEFLRNNSLRQKGSILIKAEPLRSIDIALRRMTVRSAVLLLGVGGLSFRHLEELEDLLWNRRQGSEVHLPGGCIALTETMKTGTNERAMCLNIKKMSQ